MAQSKPVGRATPSEARARGRVLHPDLPGEATDAARMAERYGATQRARPEPAPAPELGVAAEPAPIMAVMLEVLQTTKALLEEQKHAVKLLQKSFEKLSCAEMRQTHASGESTDIARMAEAYFSANSAQFSSHHQKLLLEMVYTKGEIDAVEYHGLFHDKDVRRKEIAVAVAWTTLEMETKNFYDLYQTTSCEHMHSLFKLMPSFREMLLFNARTRDREMTPEARNELPFGTYEDRISRALGELPSGLVLLHDLCHPLDTKWQVCPKQHQVESIPEDDAYELLPKSVKTYVSWARAGNLVKAGATTGEAVTQALVKWTDIVHILAEKTSELQKAEWYAQYDEYDKEAEAKREEHATACVLRYLEGNRPSLHKIVKDHEKLQAMRAKQAPASSSGEPAEAEP